MATIKNDLTDTLEVLQTLCVTKYGGYDDQLVWQTLQELLYSIAEDKAAKEMIISLSEVIRYEAHERIASAVEKVLIDLK